MDDTPEAAGGEAAANAGASQVIALVRDLMFVSRIGGAAKTAGVAIKLVRDPSALSAAEPGHRLIADLNLAGAIEAASRWKQAAPGREVVGFVSHVDTETIGRARAAGFDEVMARSRFVSVLPELLAPARASRPTPPAT
jgi:hypothetical protein